MRRRGCRRAPPREFGNNDEFTTDRRERDLTGCPRNDDRQVVQAGVSPRGRRRRRRAAILDEQRPRVQTPPDSRTRWSSAVGAGYRNRQRNTHSTELRAVRYPWHPWFGRTVTVYEALTKGGYAICRCGFDDQRNDRSLEVPAWMFEPAVCDHLRVADTPLVDCQALIELKAVLHTALRADVLQAQHHSLTARGDADATIPSPTTSLATDPVSFAISAPALSGAAAGHPGTDDSTAGPTASPAGRPDARRR